MSVEIAGTDIGASVGQRPAHLLRQVIRRPVGAICLAWLTLVLLAAIGASWIAPSNPDAQNLAQSFSGPSAHHWLGTDELGRDVLSRVIYGGRVSLLSCAEAVVAYVVIGVLFGLLAGYLGGRVDRFIMRCSDLLLSLPAVVIVVVVLAIFTHNENIAMTVFGLLAAGGLARVVRASAMAVTAEPFVAAARAAGLTTWQILRRHILPQVSSPIIVLASLMAVSALQVEVGLDFLGLGVQPPTPSWGGLVADASLNIYRQPWLLVPAGAIIILTALAFGMFGDVVRDVMGDRASGGVPLSWRGLQTRAELDGQETDPTPDEDAVLSVRGLTVEVPGSEKTRWRTVEDVSFDVRRGEALGLVGESGCGKTMAISGLLRLLPPGGTVRAESVRFDGRELMSLSEAEMRRVRGSDIAYIGQEAVASLDPTSTVGTQISEAVRYHTGASRSEARSRTLQLLGQVHLPDPAVVARKYPHQLSGGMAQRVGIARALAGQPRLLIADEPTTALDVRVQAEILDLLRELRLSTGMALLLVTHDWGVVADSCDRAIVMYAGEIVEDATVAEVFRRPRHRYTAGLLAANPSNATAGTRLPVLPGTVPPPGERPSTCRFAPRCAEAADDCVAAAVTMRRDPTGAFRCLHPVTNSTEVHHVG
jgi:peptide/nickel transport system permease protein